MEAARLWARGELDEDQDEDDADTGNEQLDKAFAAFGLVPDGPVIACEPAFYLWPENVEAWGLFKQCGTQWRGGMSGRDGMDYAGVQIVMCDIFPIPRSRRRQRMREIHVMVVSALNEWAEARQKAQ